MEYKIKVGTDTRDIIDAFRFAMDKFRDSIETRIPKGQRDDINIVYTDDYENYEYNIPYYEFVNTLNNKILAVLENIERIETKTDEVETITI